MRTLCAVALAAALTGCSSQPPLHVQAAAESRGTNGSTRFERTAEPTIRLATFRTTSPAAGTRSAGARRTEKPSSAHARPTPRPKAPPKARLAATKSTTIAAKAERATARIPLPRSSPKTQRPGNATESGTTDDNNAARNRTAGRANSDTRTTEARVAAATALAERVTAATASAAPDKKTDSTEGSGRLETAMYGAIEKPGSAPAYSRELPVAVLMARQDMTSISDLADRTIAIDDMYSASNRAISTALGAAGAPSVQLSEGQGTAINRLLDGEVSAAVVALVSAEAARGFPEIPGFRIFRIPLSAASVKARP